MIAVNTHEAKTRLSELLLKIEKNHEKIIICRSGRPVAELRPIEKGRDPLKQHPKLKKVILNDDPSRPLTEDEWPKSMRRGR